MYADELILDMTILKLDVQEFRLKSGINSLAKTYRLSLSWEGT